MLVLGWGVTVSLLIFNVGVYKILYHTGELQVDVVNDQLTASLLSSKALNSQPRAVLLIYLIVIKTIWGYYRINARFEFYLNIPLNKLAENGHIVIPNQIGKNPPKA